MLNTSERQIVYAALGERPESAASVPKALPVLMMLAAVLEAKLGPLKADVRRLSAELESIHRQLPPPLVSVTEAAQRLGLSLSSVRRRIRDGSLPVRRIGRSLRVDLGALHPPGEQEVARLVEGTKRLQS